MVFGNSFSTHLAHRDLYLSTSRGQPGPSRRRVKATKIAASYSRYSSELQDASSIDQQRRKCQEKARQDGHEILPELEFADEAISGTKRERVGLNAMLEAARGGRFQTLYFESLSRLARESVITMPMLKELVYVHHVRIVSASEGIDSAQQNWDLIASFMSWQHEQFLRTLRAAVLRGQEEAVLKDWSVGDYPFGYTSVPIPGTESSRRSRQPRPRMSVVIAEDHAQWVRQIFTWFVEEKRSLDWIARELTRQQAPKDHRSKTPGWHHDYVKRVLRNRKYIGIWSWGKHTNVRNPLSGQVRQEARSDDDVGKWVRERPQLRIIDDILFFRAQAILDESSTRWAAVRDVAGKLRGSQVDTRPGVHLLQGLFACAVCGKTFQVCGSNGDYLGCSGFKRGLCRCKTRLHRRSAEARVMAAIRDRLFAQPQWLDAVVSEALEAWQEQQRQEPSELAAVERNIARLDSQIARIIDAVERAEGESPELAERLRERCREKKQLEHQQSRLLATNRATTDAPTREWIEGKLRHMDEVLREGKADAANGVLRQLVGTRIVLEEAGTPGRKRKHLVGRFLFSSEAFWSEARPRKERDSGISPQTGQEIVITFRDDPPWAALADDVKKRFDQGLEFERIAAELNCPRPWVTQALAWWHHQDGSPPPDGRRTRSRLNRPTAAAKLADAAKKLWDDKLPMQEIARKLNCNRSTLIEAIRHWFESRSLPVPDGRHRRKELRLERESM